MQKWEYLYVKAYKNDFKEVRPSGVIQINRGIDNLIPALNELGIKGWELVSTISLADADEPPGTWRLNFKRPIENVNDNFVEISKNITNPKDIEGRLASGLPAHPEAANYHLCPKCHHSNPKNAIICEKCGTKL